MAKKNSLRVGAGERYAIEVNDRGETIEFDLSDISLAVRMNEAYGALLKQIDALACAAAPKAHKARHRQCRTQHALHRAAFFSMP